jgi:hypothetical protein
MKTVNDKKIHKTARTARHPGVRHAARLLGCTAGHLHQVLDGKRISKRLMLRYRSLKAGRAATSTGKLTI